MIFRVTIIDVLRFRILSTLLRIHSLILIYFRCCSHRAWRFPSWKYPSTGCLNSVRHTWRYLELPRYRGSLCAVSSRMQSVLIQPWKPSTRHSTSNSDNINKNRYCLRCLCIFFHVAFRCCLTIRPPYQVLMLVLCCMLVRYSMSWVDNKWSVFDSTACWRRQRRRCCIRYLADILIGVSNGRGPSASRSGRLDWSASSAYSILIGIHNS